MRARVRDTDIFFDVDGPVLVPDNGVLRERSTAFLIHGGPGTDHAGMRARYGPLASRMQLVYFDHRGQGRSARGNPNLYTLDENVEDMEALRVHLGLGPIVSIGTSYGGRVAMAHAARYPTAVSHLVLIATSAYPRASALRAKEIVAAIGTPEQIQACEDLYAGRIDTPEKLARYFEVLGPLYSRSYTPQTGIGLGSAILTTDALNRAYGPGGFLWDLDLRPELAAIQAPTLILAGRHDFRCAPEFSEEMHALIEGSELRIFEDSSHSIGADEPQKLLDAIADFLVRKTKEHGT